MHKHNQTPCRTVLGQTLFIWKLIGDFIFVRKSKTEAVVKTIKDEIKLKKMEKIKAMAGKMEFVKSADKLRHEDERLSRV